MSDVKQTCTIAEACAILGIGQSLMRKMIRDGKIRSIRFGRKILIPRIVIVEILNTNDTGN